ncbi:membrane protein CcdC involved in cytochrome C biogenesis [Salsuginibacillus halophilus]|uniref:Membrane protein CcdC involved in cytochrome C biogenesis n=1 Tax=Salsuginibacillus halophilus TaxID=517424 RepID=A0A2P8HYK5_9BACI|nr:CcdC protein domain-containing protein [Salsuginibacillus halophilus]PSL51311.1 membrane protein CcdC involved in cytochrome C biogenesis [Salsuginibacillus halophilus]
MSWIFVIGAAVMGAIAMVVRMRATKKPATVKKIILPPVFMSTGFLMFVYEPARLSTLQILEALTVGLLFSIVLIKTSKFEWRHGFIYMQRSKAFVFILIGLLVARILFKLIIGDAIHYAELAGMFFILAYGMIIPWRLAMLYKFKRLEKEGWTQEETSAAVRAT